MKLLFDENLWPKLPRLLAPLFADSAHVRECRLLGFPDEDVGEYARANGFTIVSKDSDFQKDGVSFALPRTPGRIKSNAPIRKARSRQPPVAPIAGRSFCKIAMPRKIRELVADLINAGFDLAPGGKGSHRKFRHSKFFGSVILSGQNGEDARHYQESQVRNAIRKVRQ